MQINRLFEIIYLLLNQKTSTAKALAEHFEVSQRTIYRDIETLCASGIPIYTTKGKGGGIHLLDDFVLNKSILSEQEQNDILSALQTMSVTNDNDVSHVLSKLSVLFNKQMLNWVEIDFSNWSNQGKDDFSLIKFAILNRIVIAFDYYNSYGQKSHREVQPLQLFFKEKTWYLKAFCLQKNSMRLFKLTRIKHLVQTSKAFQLAAYSEDSTDHTYIYQAKMVTLKLKIDASQAYRVYDDFDETIITINDNHSFIVSPTFPEDDWVYGYILSYGTYIEVLEPIHIREIIKNKLKETMKLYF